MSGPTAPDAAAQDTPPPVPGIAAPVRHRDAPAPGTVLGSHYEQCFGCGETQKHGLRLVTRAGEGVSVTAEFTVRPEHQGAPGLAHGGVLVTALDEALGSLNWMLRTSSVTGHLQTDFVRPVPVGTVLHLTARCTAARGRKIYSEAVGRMGSPDGPVAVRAEALFVQVEPRHFVDHGREEDVRAAKRSPVHQNSARAFGTSP